MTVVTGLGIIGINNAVAQVASQPRVSGESELIIRGDLDNDWQVDVMDVVQIIDFLFASGPTPQPQYRADANCDGHYNLVDAVSVVRQAFSGADPCSWEFSDDFGDGSLDPRIWAAPYGNVTEAGGVCYLRQRGYLNFIRPYDPSKYNVKVQIDVMFQSEADFMDIVTRSDGVSNPNFYGEVMNGLKLGIKASDVSVPNNGVAIDQFVNGNIQKVPNQVVYLDLPNMLPVYNFVALDSENVYTIVVNGSQVCTASGALPVMGNRFSFYNREYGYELSIDNLRITAKHR